MNIITHNIGEIKIAEITSDEIILNSTQDGIDLLGNLYYQEFNKVMIHKQKS